LIRQLRVKPAAYFTCGCDSRTTRLIIFHLDMLCRSGEIGIRTRLKIWRGQTHVGSSPTSGTNKRFFSNRSTNPSITLTKALYALSARQRSERPIESAYRPLPEYQLSRSGGDVERKNL